MRWPVQSLDLSIHCPRILLPELKDRFIEEVIAIPLCNGAIQSKTRERHFQKRLQQNFDGDGRQLGYIIL